MAPGVSHRESGGLTVRQAIDAIHAIPGLHILLMLSCCLMNNNSFL